MEDWSTVQLGTLAELSNNHQEIGPEALDDCSQDYLQRWTELDTQIDALTGALQAFLREYWETR